MYTERLIAAIDSRPNLVMSITLEAATRARTTFVAVCSVPGDASPMAEPEVLNREAPFCPLSNNISVFLSSSIRLWRRETRQLFFGFFAQSS